MKRRNWKTDTGEGGDWVRKQKHRKAKSSNLCTFLRWEVEQKWVIIARIWGRGSLGKRNRESLKKSILQVTLKSSGGKREERPGLFQSGGLRIHLKIVGAEGGVKEINSLWAPYITRGTSGFLLRGKRERAPQIRDSGALPPPNTKQRRQTEQPKDPDVYTG